MHENLPRAVASKLLASSRPARARVCMCDVGVGVGVAVGATGGGCRVGARARTFFAGWALIVGVGRVQDAAHDPVPPQLRH